MNRWPSLFSCVMLNGSARISYSPTQKDLSAHAVIFGKPETGNPIPAEQINAVACVRLAMVAAEHSYAPLLGA
jgi:hypothetical protein